MEEREMKTVAEILKTKGREVWTITPDTIVFDALKIMAEKNVGALVVLDGATVAGILSERDYARKVILHGRSSRELKAKEIMSAKCVLHKSRAEHRRLHGALYEQARATPPAL